MLCSDFLGRLIEQLSLAVGQQQTRTLRGEALGRRSADPPRRAGDQHPFALESPHHASQLTFPRAAMGQTASSTPRRIT